MEMVIPVPECGCWIYEGASSGEGYAEVWEKGRRTRAHRWFYEKLVGEIPAGMHLCHACDVRCCVNPAHMFIGTQQANMTDKTIKGRHAHGARHGMAKLTEIDVLAARSSSESNASIARRLGVTPTTIGYIKKGKVWKHVR